MVYSICDYEPIFHYGVEVILMRTGNCTGKKHDSCHVGLYT